MTEEQVILIWRVGTPVVFFLVFIAWCISLEFYPVTKNNDKFPFWTIVFVSSTIAAALWPFFLGILLAVCLLWLIRKCVARVVKKRAELFVLLNKLGEHNKS